MHTKQEIFDINLVALMIQNKIDTIITADDKHFKNIKEINVINPFKQENKEETGNVSEGLDPGEKIEETPKPDKKEKEEK